MKLIRILGASVVKVANLVPQGGVFVPALVKKVVKEYEFVDYPRSADSMNLTNGVEFKLGRCKGAQIDRLMIYWTGILIEGQGKTSSLEEVVSNIMSPYFSGEHTAWRELPSSPTLYGSRLEVNFEGNIGRKFDAFQQLSGTITTLLRSHAVLTPPYEFAGFMLHTDLTISGIVKPGRFAFERRAEQPYAENIYYSEAPLSTEEHMIFLEKLSEAI